jgi:hypothetical protein
MATPLVEGLNASFVLKSNQRHDEKQSDAFSVMDWVVKQYNIDSTIIAENKFRLLPGFEVGLNLNREGGSQTRCVCWMHWEGTEHHQVFEFDGTAQIPWPCMALFIQYFMAVLGGFNTDAVRDKGPTRDITRLSTQVQKAWDAIAKKRSATRPPIPPQNRTIPPQNRTIPPQNRTIPPQNRTIPPQNRTSPPQNRTSPPQNRTSPPQNRIIPPPPQSQMDPKKTERPPTGKQPQTYNSQHVSVNPEIAPAQNQHMKIPKADELWGYLEETVKSVPGENLQIQPDMLGGVGSAGNAHGYKQLIIVGYYVLNIFVNVRIVAQLLSVNFYRAFADSDIIVGQPDLMTQLKMFTDMLFIPFSDKGDILGAQLCRSHTLKLNALAKAANANADEVKPCCLAADLLLLYHRHFAKDANLRDVDRSIVDFLIRSFSNIKKNVALCQTLENTFKGKLRKHYNMIEPPVRVYVRLRSGQTPSGRYTVQTTHASEMPGIRQEIVVRYMPQNGRMPEYTKAWQERSIHNELPNTALLNDKPIPFEFAFGPFDGVFNSLAENTKIAEAIGGGLTSQINEGKSVMVIGYGPSGSGKTSTLIRLKKNDGSFTPGVLISAIKKVQALSLTVIVSQFVADDSNPQRGTKTATESLEFQRTSVGDGFTHVAVEKITRKTTILLLIDYLADRIDTEQYRRISGTPNNPVSSRSHVVAEIQFNMEGGSKPFLFICDFAGVEERFDCTDTGALVDFLHSHEFDKLPKDGWYRQNIDHIDASRKFDCWDAAYKSNQEPKAADVFDVRTSMRLVAQTAGALTQAPKKSAEKLPPAVVLVCEAATKAIRDVTKMLDTPGRFPLDTNEPFKFYTIGGQLRCSIDKTTASDLLKNRIRADYLRDTSKRYISAYTLPIDYTNSANILRNEKVSDSTSMRIPLDHIVSAASPKWTDNPNGIINNELERLVFRATAHMNQPNIQWEQMWGKLLFAEGYGYYSKGINFEQEAYTYAELLFGLTAVISETTTMYELDEVSKIRPTWITSEGLNQTPVKAFLTSNDCETAMMNPDTDIYKLVILLRSWLEKDLDGDENKNRRNDLKKAVFNIVTKSRNRSGVVLNKYYNNSNNVIDSRLVPKSFLFMGFELNEAMGVTSTSVVRMRAHKAGFVDYLKTTWGLKPETASTRFDRMHMALFMAHVETFVRRRTALQIMSKVCECRAWEGTYINKTLASVGKSLRQLMEVKVQQRSTLRNVPPVMLPHCTAQLCGPFDSCYTKTIVSNNTIDEILWTAIFRRVLGFTTQPVPDSDQVRGYLKTLADKLKLVVFGVFNFTANKYADGTEAQAKTPYVSTAILQAELNRMIRSAAETLMASDAGPQTKLAAGLTLSHHINPVVISQFSRWVKMEEPYYGTRRYTEIVDLMKTALYADGENYSSLLSLIDFQDRVNASSQLGAFEYLDAFAKWGRSPTSCTMSPFWKSQFPALGETWTNMNGALVEAINPRQ